MNAVMTRLARGARTLLPSLALAIAASFAAPGWAQTLRDDTAPFDKPDGKPQTASWKAGSTLKVLRRQGFWVEVESAGKVGWVKVSSIVFGSAGGPAAIDTGRMGTGNIVSASAARGLSARDLLEGKPDFAEVAKLDLLTADAATLDAFKTSGGIRPPSERIALQAPRPMPPGAAQASPATSAPTRETRKKDGDDW